MQLRYITFPPTARWWCHLLAAAAVVAGTTRNEADSVWASVGGIDCRLLVCCGLTGQHSPLPSAQCLKFYNVGTLILGTVMPFLVKLEVQERKIGAETSSAQ